jgi:hypothetical protein
VPIPLLPAKVLTSPTTISACFSGLDYIKRYRLRSKRVIITTHSMLEAGFDVETALCLDADYYKAFKSMPKDKA